MKVAGPHGPWADGAAASGRAGALDTRIIASSRSVATPRGKGDWLGTVTPCGTGWAARARADHRPGEPLERLASLLVGDVAEARDEQRGIDVWPAGWSGLALAHFDRERDVDGVADRVALLQRRP